MSTWEVDIPFWARGSEHEEVDSYGTLSTASVSRVRRLEGRRMDENKDGDESVERSKRRVVVSFFAGEKFILEMC